MTNNTNYFDQKFDSADITPQRLIDYALNQLAKLALNKFQRRF